MCGITGFWQQTAGEQECLICLAREMNGSLVHRGPDDGGEWADAPAGLALANRRLAILDLSPAGHQPMISQCGRFAIVYNGEVYNFGEIRRELEADGCRFRSRSDTEAILEACARWGVGPAVARMNGMFAFAFWDGKRRRLTLARDRMGIKPLYYGRFQGTFLFGSEMKALRRHPQFRGEIDYGSLALFFRHGYIPAPYSIFQGILKLPAGHLLTLGGPLDQASPSPYWSAAKAAQEGLNRPFEGNFEEAADHLEALLRDAVRMRMISDVPIGAFLSGGIDSSAIAALMQAQSTAPVRTFSIGFQEAGYNEAGHAAQVAKRLGTDHTELYVTPEQARQVIVRLPEMYDEPFADSSQIPTFLVSEMTRRHVTVSLSGDGGDELFCGYDDYLRGSRRWRLAQPIPPVLRGAAASAADRLARRPRTARLLSRLLPSRAAGRLNGERLHRMARSLRAGSPQDLHLCAVSHWLWPDRLMQSGVEGLTAYSDPRLSIPSARAAENMMLADQLAYLPDDILTKLDRASMSVSLEARVPMLDYRVVEFAWRLPLGAKLARGGGKRILRCVLQRYLPPSLFERPKMGFRVPVELWMRNELHEWAEDLLQPSSLEEAGLVPAEVEIKWSEHLSGRQDWGRQLWCVLMFQAWRQRWM